MSIRLMHLADLHLGAPFSYLGDKARQRAQDLESALARALKLAPEKNVHAIVIAGDLFDSFNPPPDLVARVKAAFDEAARNGIHIILIPGTHDSHRYAQSVYRREQLPGVDILLDDAKPIRKNLNGQDVHFYGFSGGYASGRGEPPFRRGDGEGLHVALVHGSVTDGTHWVASPRDYSLRPAELEASGFDYVALGHHHNFREVGRDVPAVYPGTLEGLKFGENGDRYLVIAEIDENRAAIEKVKHNRRTLSEIQIEPALAGIGCDDELSAAIEKHADPDAIVRVHLSGPANFIPSCQGVEARLADRFFHLEIADETSMYDSEMIRSVKTENTVRGIFVRKMLERIERASDEERTKAKLALRLGIEQFTRIGNENQQTPD